MPVEPAAGYLDFAVRAGVALLGGALIGLERERAQFAGARGRKAGGLPGLRSVGLVSLYGFLVSHVSLVLIDSTGLWLVILAMGAAGLTLLVMLYAYARMIVAGSQGLTTHLVLLTTFMIGVLSGLGLVLEAAGLSIVVGLLLASKDPVVRLAKSISYGELIAMMEVAALIVVIGPLVSALKPSVPFVDIMQVYMFLVAVVGVVFGSYVAARIWGERGAAAGLVLGALVNSEAVIAAVGRLSSTSRVAARSMPYIALIVIAVMEARSAALSLYAILIAEGSIPGEVAAPFALVASASMLALALAVTRLGGNVPAVKPRSPLDWGLAVRSALVYAALTVAAKAVVTAAGEAGTGLILAVAAAGGLVNATAAILSMASIAGEAGLRLAAAGMLVAIAFSSMNKAIYARIAGADWRIARTVAAAGVLMSLPPLLAAALLLSPA